ncbi:hypothetical protein PR048_009608 [Dryococelus australis]|uniref:Uncharacterized protein n=1 Tax=Dryococelus australis TaxID=614101 RepID=A0ABQ9I0C0_9NEOP|nr:hypothetical protein PR048_009608 [Dryococelus australis]
MFTRQHSSVPLALYSFWRGRGGVVVRLLASHLDKPGSIPVACNSCAGRCRGSVGFFRGTPVSSFPFVPSSAPYSPRFTLIGSQDLDVKSCLNLFTHSLFLLVLASGRRIFLLDEDVLMFRGAAEVSGLSELNAMFTVSQFHIPVMYSPVLVEMSLGEKLLSDSSPRDCAQSHMKQENRHRIKLQDIEEIFLWKFWAKGKHIPSSGLKFLLKFKEVLLPTGAVVVQLSDYSPPTKANLGLDSRQGRAGRCRGPAGFLGDPQFPHS